MSEYIDRMCREIMEKTGSDMVVIVAAKMTKMGDKSEVAFSENYSVKGKKYKVRSPDIVREVARQMAERIKASSPIEEEEGNGYDNGSN